MGDLGPDAHRFIMVLEEAGQSLWQFMPLGPPGAGDSPYAARSAFAGDPRMVSLELLADDGFLERADVPIERPTREHHERLLRRAHRAFLDRGLGGELEAFAERHGWARPYAKFAALRRLTGRPWWEWGEALPGDTAAEESFVLFGQYWFERHWQGLREHAARRKIRLMGDVPIFVDLDSADAWANRELFKLDAEGRPEVVAGVPPDAFSETGQRWGNPLYDWETHRRDGFRWWRERFAHLFSQVDAVRLDHFRGFVAAWEIPAENEDARAGEWVPGPGRELMDAILEATGGAPLAVEDLGMITPDVYALRDDLALPGMLVLQFAFGDEERTWHNPHLPHNHVVNAVAYTGTHDNDTTAGWWEKLDAVTRARVIAYLGGEPADAVLALIRLLQSSVAHTAIVPWQDWLRLGREARMNLPGTAEGNWQWHFSWEQVTPALPREMAAIAEVYGRDPM